MSAATGTSARRSHLYAWSIAAAILIGGSVAYSNSFEGPFIFDDVPRIAQNPVIREFWPLSRFQTGFGGNRPVAYMTFAVNYAIHGLDVWGYHLVNLVIHLVNALLIWFGLWSVLDVSRVRSGDDGGHHRTSPMLMAGAVALLWVVHPLNTGAVTFMYQRIESLAALFYLASFNAFVVGCRRKHASVWFGMAVASCFLGAATKEILFSLPLVTLWFDRAFIASSWRELRQRRGLVHGALFASWLVMLFLNLSWKDKGAAGQLGDAGISPIEYALTQAEVILWYLRLTFVPIGQCLDYLWPIARDPVLITLNVSAVAALVILTGIAVSRWPRWSFLGAWFFLILGPTSSLAPLADVAFEHRMYLPLVAVLTLTLLGVDAAVRVVVRRPRVATGICAVLFAGTMLVLIGLTMQRNRLYASPLAMWSDVVDTAPWNYRAWNNLAVAQHRAGNLDAAIESATRSIELQANYPNAYVNRGAYFAERKRYERAVADLSRAIALAPNEFPTAYVQRALISKQRGELAASLSDLDRAIEVDANHFEALNNRGNLLLAVGRADAAIEDLSRAITIRPGQPSPYVSRGVAAKRLGRYREALEDYSRALEIDPDFVNAYYNRSLALFELGRVAQAIDDMTAYLNRQPQAADARILRARMFLHAGQRDAAARDAAQVMRLGVALPEDLATLVRGAAHPEG